MKLRWLPSLLLLRRLVRELSGIREQLTRQVDLLARIAQQVAPLPPAVDRDLVSAETGIDYVDPIDQALLLDYAARTEHDTGHRPTDDELLSYLADEKTVDLHTRLLERDRQAERLAAEHRR